MARQRSLLWIVLSRVIGLAVFLIVLLAINLLKAYITSPLYQALVNFVNSNLVLLLVISIIFLIADVFWALHFPFNLPAPLFSAVAAVFLVMFMLHVFEFIMSISPINLSPVITIFSFIIYPIVFILVLVFGYLSIFLGIFRSRRTYRNERRDD